MFQWLECAHPSTLRFSTFFHKVTLFFFDYLTRNYFKDAP